MIGVYQAKKENKDKEYLPTPGGKTENRRLEELGEVPCDLSREHLEGRGSMKLARKAGSRWRESWFRYLRFQEGCICSDWSKECWKADVHTPGLESQLCHPLTV